MNQICSQLEYAAAEPWSKKVKILNFELLNQICSQLGYAAALVAKVIEFYIVGHLIKICPQLRYTAADLWSPKCQNSIFV